MANHGSRAEQSKTGDTAGDTTFSCALRPSFGDGGGASWFSRSWLSKSDDKLPIVLLLKYYTYSRGATAQTLSAGGPGLIAPGGTPGKIKWPELGVTELRFRDRLDPADSD